MATEIAAAYVSLIPSFAGGGAAIAHELAPAAATAGAESGKRAGAGFKGSFGGVMATAAKGGAIFGGAAALASGFDAAISEADLPGALQAQFGLTAPVAEQAAETAGRLYSQGWGQSLGGVGTAVAGVQRALDGLGTGESVTKVTTQAEALAQSFGEDVNPLIVAASQLVKTDMAPTMESAFDLITRGFQGGANASGDFLDTLTEYPVQFQSLGLSGATAIGLINQGLAAGARNSDLVADAIKEFSIRAVDGSTITAEGFEAIGLNAGEMSQRIAQGGDTAAGAFAQTLDAIRSIDSPLARSQAAVKLFGTQSEDTANALLALDPATAAVSGGMDDVTGAAQGVADQISGGTQTQLSTLARTFSQGLAGGLSLLIPLFTGLFGILQPFLPILGPMALAIGAITLAQWAWNAALAANPITLIILAVVGLVAGIALLLTKVGGFRDFWVGAWHVISGAAVAVWNWIKSNWPHLLAILTGPVGIAVDLIAHNWETIKGGATAVKDWIVDKFNDILNFFRGIPGAIGGFFSGLADAIKGPFVAAFNGIASVWNNSVGSLSFHVPDWVPGVGGKGFDVPDIPTLAEGGIVDQPTLALIGEGPEAEAVTPLSQLERMIGAGDQAARSRHPVTVNVYAQPGDDIEVLARRVSRLIARAA